MKINIHNQKGEQVGEHNLSLNIFNVEANPGLIHQAVLAQMGNQRQVLAHTKDRSEVRGGGKKPWKQKGTGRARAGSNRSPIWIGGGVTFGPIKTRNFSKKINKKMKQKALLHALSDKALNKALVVLDKLEVTEHKTKEMDSIIKNLEAVIGSKKPKQEKIETKESKKAKPPKRSILIINDKKDDKIKYSGRNLVGIEIINLENINILDLLKYKNLVLTLDTVKKLEKIYK